MTRIPGPRTNWNDLTSFDYLSLSQRERDEIRREAVRRAHAERAAMMDAVICAIPRLIGRALVRLTARKRVRAPVIPGRKILQV